MKVLTVNLSRYRIDTLVILLDRGESENGVYKVVGLEVAIARFTDADKLHDQKALNVLSHLTAGQKSSLEAVVTAVAQSLKQAENVQ